MLNYQMAVEPRSMIDLSSMFPLVEPQQKDGVVVLVPVTDKYKGMKAVSFSISSQLEVGARLTASPSIDFNSINENDRLTRELSHIVNLENK